MNFKELKAKHFKGHEFCQIEECNTLQVIEKCEEIVREAVKELKDNLNSESIIMHYDTLIYLKALIDKIFGVEKEK